MNSRKVELIELANILVDTFGSFIAKTHITFEEPLAQVISKIHNSITYPDNKAQIVVGIEDKDVYGKFCGYCSAATSRGGKGSCGSIGRNKCVFLLPDPNKTTVEVNYTGIE